MPSAGMKRVPAVGRSTCSRGFSRKVMRNWSRKATCFTRGKTMGRKLSQWKKLKLSQQDVYMLALRQILLNQSEILKLVKDGRSYEFLNDSRELADRIGEFLEEGQ